MSKNLFKSVAQRLTGNLSLLTSQVFVSLFVAKWLGPEALGKLAFFVVILNYYSYSNLGLTNGITRNLSIAFGEKKKLEQQNILSSSFTFQLLITALFSILIILFSFTIKHDMVFYWLVAFIGFFQMLVVYMERVNSAYEKHNIIMQANLLKAVLSIIITVALVYYFDLIGRFFAFLIINIIVAIFFWIDFKHVFAKIDFSVIKELLSIGIPIAFIGFLFATVYNMDKLIIKYYLSNYYLGIYAFGFSFLKVVEKLKNSAGVVIYQRMNIIYGEDNASPMRIIELSLQSSVLLTTILTILSFLGFIILYYLIPFFFIKYKESINLIPFLLFSQAIIAINILNTIAKFKVYIFILSFMVIFNIILNFIFISKFGIEGVAAVTFLTFFIQNLIISFYSLKLTNTLIKKNILKILFITFVPGIMMILIIAWFRLDDYRIIILSLIIGFIIYLLKSSKKQIKYLKAL